MDLRASWGHGRIEGGEMLYFNLKIVLKKNVNLHFNFYLSI